MATKPPQREELLPCPDRIQVTRCGKCGQLGIGNTRCSQCRAPLFFSDEITFTRTPSLTEAREKALDFVDSWIVNISNYSTVAAEDQDLLTTRITALLQVSAPPPAPSSEIEAAPDRPVSQPWTHSLPMMQQTVLLTAVRGPDGLAKYGCVKMLLRWFRRCTLLSAMDGKALANPYDNNGGSFTGPSLSVKTESWEAPMDEIVSEYLRTLDAVPHHFQLHFMHAAEILGYKHPDARLRAWWNRIYIRLVNDMHVHPETEEEMNERLGDNREGWLKRADHATTA